MQTNSASTYLPFGLGEPRLFGGLTIVPLFPERDPVAAYVGLDEATASGLIVTELDEAGAVETLLVTNTLGTATLLYEGEELTGAKQNRILERSILVAAGALVGIAGRLVCLDYVSRSDVFAGLYLKLLRGYALSAIETPVDKPLRRRDLGRFLGELELAKRTRRPAVGLGEEGVLTEYAVGSELVLDGEVVALSAYPGQA